MKTPGKFKWSKSSYFPDYQPDSIIYDDGDGTVNIRSLETCKRWNTDNNDGKNVCSKNLVNVQKIFY